MKRKITWQEIKERVEKLPKNKKYFGVPKGGIYISAMLNPVETPEECDIIIDDLIDSGKTMERYKRDFPDKEFIGLFDKRFEMENEWLEFPWEIEDQSKEIGDYLLRIAQYLNIKIKLDDGI